MKLKIKKKKKKKRRLRGCLTFKVSADLIPL